MGVENCCCGKERAKDANGQPQPVRVQQMDQQRQLGPMKIKSHSISSGGSSNLSSQTSLTTNAKTRSELIQSRRLRFGASQVQPNSGSIDAANSVTQVKIEIGHSTTTAASTNSDQKLLVSVSTKSSKHRFLGRTAAINVVQQSPATELIQVEQQNSRDKDYVASVDNIDLETDEPSEANERFIADATVYLNKQAKRLQAGNLTDQRVALTLAETAGNLEDELRALSESVTQFGRANRQERLPRNLAELAASAQLDSQHAMLCQLALPVVKVGGNDYLIGTSVKKVTLQKGQALVRQATSYTSLREHLRSCAYEEFMALQEKINQSEQTLESVVSALLERYKCQRHHKQNFLLDLELLRGPFFELSTVLNTNESNLQSTASRPIMGKAVNRRALSQPHMNNLEGRTAAQN